MRILSKIIGIPFNDFRSMIDPIFGTKSSRTLPLIEVQFL